MSTCMYNICWKIEVNMFKWIFISFPQNFNLLKVIFENVLLNGTKNKPEISIGYDDPTLGTDWLTDQWVDGQMDQPTNWHTKWDCTRLDRQTDGPIGEVSDNCTVYSPPPQISTAGRQICIDDQEQWVHFLLFPGCVQWHMPSITAMVKHLLHHSPIFQNNTLWKQWPINLKHGW